MRSAPPLRGQVFFVDVADAGAKPVLLVSNNQRNRALSDVLAVRITTAPKPDLPSIVPLPDTEAVAGRVLCDDIFAVPREQLGRHAGALSRPTMRRVDEGLKEALGIRD